MTFGCSSILHVMTDYVYGECFCPSLEVCALPPTVLVKMSNVTGMYNCDFAGHSAIFA